MTYYSCFYADGVTPVHNAKVGVIQQNGIRGNSVSYVRASTDHPYRENGYCIAHPCKNDVRDSSSSLTYGLILTDTGKSYIAVAPRPLIELDWQTLVASLDYDTQADAISVQLHLRESEEQEPFYNWESPKWPHSQSC